MKRISYLKKVLEEERKLVDLKLLFYAFITKFSVFWLQNSGIKYKNKVIALDTIHIFLFLNLRIKKTKIIKQITNGVMKTKKIVNAS